MTLVLKSFGHRVLGCVPEPYAWLVYDAWDFCRSMLGLSIGDNERLDLLDQVQISGVQQGPFTSMPYVQRAHGSAWLPKVLGTYEREIYPAVERLIAYQPDLVVDIGSAEGYYAVGMARRLPNAQVVAFDIDSRARHALGKLIRINRVADRVQVKRLCTVDGLEQLLASASRPVVICDCEGGENELLDPQAVSSLHRTHILVEVHDFLIPDTGQRLRQAFAPSHDISEIDSRNPNLNDLLSPMAGITVQHLAERAQPMQWFEMIPQEYERLNGR